MKHLLRASFLLLTAWCLALAGVQQAHASHAQGGQLTYEYIGDQFNPVRPNLYKVTCRFFRDCGGIDAPTSLTLNCRVGTPTTSCNSNDSRNFTATLVRGVLSSGTPYCTSVGNPCTSGGRTNYETAKYEATVTLAPAASWTLSVVENARPALANIPGNTDMYFEATLNNQLTLASGTTANINNTSPQYLDQDVPVPFVCKEQRTTLTFSAFEPDGDSLVYSLDRPLDGCNDPATYKSFTSQGGFILAPEHTPQNPCLIALPTGATTFSPTFPIPSFTVGGSCPVKTATPSFAFNSNIGSFTFTPFGYDATTPANNKYVVVGKVSEYRKINGRYYLVGSVRRDMLVIIIDCGGNTVPSAPVATGVTPGSGTITVNSADSTFVTVYSCNYSQVKVNFRDPDAGQLLTVTVDPVALGLLADVVVPNGFVLSGNGTTSPTATFFFQPSPQLVGTVVRIPVTIVDNACPIRGRQNRIIVVRVRAGQLATAVAASNGNRNPIICNGASLQLRGEVQRPDSVRGGLQQYSYTWTAANGLPVSQQNNQTVTVTPTVTTRYRLRIAPLSGFSPGLCGDTTSIVVRVVPRVQAAFRAIWADSAVATALGQTRRQPRTYNFTNFSTVDGRQTLVGIDSIKWTVQRVQDAQGNPVTETPRVFWRQRTTPRPLTLQDAGVYKVTLSVANTTPGVTCPASEVSRLLTVPFQQMPNVFTPNKDGMNDNFVVQPDMIGGKMIIFNRWGRKIREYASYNNDWDGDTQPAGVYYYQLTATDGKVTKGWVELVR